MSESNGKKTARKATELERRKIHRLLDQCCVRDSGTEDAPGDCHYINGETDESIAKKVSPDLTDASVANIRRQIFGNFHKTPKVRQPDAELAARVQSQALALGVLSNALLSLSVSFNNYMTEMGEQHRAVSTAWEGRLWAAAPASEAPAPAEAVQP